MSFLNRSRFQLENIDTNRAGFGNLGIGGPFSQGHCKEHKAYTGGRCWCPEIGEGTPLTEDRSAQKKSNKFIEGLLVMLQRIIMGWWMGHTRHLGQIVLVQYRIVLWNLWPCVTIHGKYEEAWDEGEWLFKFAEISDKVHSLREKSRFEVKLFVMNPVIYITENSECCKILHTLAYPRPIPAT